MTAHDWFIELRQDFATRALEPADEALFREHLERCEECRAAVAAIEQELRWLPMAVAPVAPRPGFAQRAVREITGKGAAHPRRRALAWLAQAAAAAAVVAAVGFGLRERGRTGELSHQLDALRDTLSVLRQANRVLQTAISMDGHQGGMMIFADEKTHRWNVVVYGLPRAPAGERYAFWFLTGDRGMVRGPDVPLDPATPAFFTLDMPEGAKIIQGGALTVEPMPGSSPAPRGRVLARLVL
jgi:hypothetical protein